eukprot:snap_masked-scaffold_84-processed-gene-0.23-mRNA-1 protein AED:1.00 eAED:1.00 QI:0/-1/0/0/-1/1/1/0/65
MQNKYFLTRLISVLKIEEGRKLIHLPYLRGFRKRLGKTLELEMNRSLTADTLEHIEDIVLYRANR